LGDVASAEQYEARAAAISAQLRHEEQARRSDRSALEAMRARVDIENWPLEMPHVYWHGVCMIDHRSSEAAARCRWSRFDPDKTQRLYESLMSKRP
jgi:hypothetical protein